MVLEPSTDFQCTFLTPSIDMMVLYAYTTVIGTQNLPFLVPFTCLFTVRTMDNTSYSTMSDFPELHTLPVILRWFMPPSVKWRFTVFVLNEYFVVYVILMYAFFLMILAMIWQIYSYIMIRFLTTCYSYSNLHSIQVMQDKWSDKLWRGKK